MCKKKQKNTALGEDTKGRRKIADNCTLYCMCKNVPTSTCAKQKNIPTSITASI